MLEDHQKLVENYKASEKKVDKSTVRIIILMVFMISIVVAMKIIQKTASLQLNIIATSAVLVLLSWHFWWFYPRRALFAGSANIILNGVKIEKENPFLKVSFFKDHLRNFTALGQVLRMAIFDLFLIYFFSVSYTQLAKAINPEIIVKLRSVTPFSTALIGLSLGWAYYKAIRPLIHLKRSMPEMGNA